MAAQLEAGKNFRYGKVQIFKSQSLGVGSYGAVCRARCGQLPCAAKLLHPILANPGAPRNQQRFEQECQFLSGIRHPHVVQYLGTCRDPESGLLVLLMELMDNSLTHFLEESQERLPCYLEVNLCHDVALALSYLHSNGIIHRDLSSNNVLLIAGSRAKVTDFGMSKLIDATPQMTPLTQCPGTLAYMSPEAKREPPVYTDKLDCFAHGVVAIQIMTRQFPNPGPASHLVNDPRYPMGKIQVLVSETERRKSHLDCIHPKHPLLPIVIQCLRYNEKDRPSAQQLCNQLAALKEVSQYVESMQQAQDRATGQREDRRLRQELEQATRNCQHQDHRIAVLQEELRKKNAVAVSSQQEVRRLSQGIQQIRHELDQTIRDKQQIRLGIQQLRHELDQKIQDNQRLREEVREKTNQIGGRERQQQDNEHIIAEFQQTLAQKEKRISHLEETISAISRERKIQQVLKKSQASNTVVDTIKLNWRQPTKAPCKMSRGSAIVDGSMAYFRPGGSSSVLAYDSDKEVWSQMPECPQEHFTLAMVKDLLTAVGGKQSLKPTNTLLSLTGEGSMRKWSEHFPPMLTKRYNTAVVCSGKSLIVAGGKGDNNTTLSTVEVMDTERLQWLNASSLPHPLYQASATICGENVYMLGGVHPGGFPTQSVFTCSLSSLLKSCQPQSLGADPKMSLGLPQDPSVWQKMVDIPVVLSTGLTLCGHLLAVGGRHSDHKPTNAIRKFDLVKNSWTVIGHMMTPRSLSVVAVLPGDKLMVVGGLTSTSTFSKSDVVEIAVSV